MTKNTKSLTLIIPEHIHHKCKIIAAIQKTSMTKVICDAIESLAIPELPKPKPRKLIKKRGKNEK